MKKTTFAFIKTEFVMTPEQIKFLESLPDNLPEAKLTQKQKDEVGWMYHQLLGGKVVKGWGTDLYEIEQKERWPSGPKVKRHEAQRMILGNLLFFNKSKKELTAQEAARMFHSGLTCRESYSILMHKVYEVKYN